MHSLTPVTRSVSEELLAGISLDTADPDSGIFGPASLSWRINRESALFLGAGRAALLQLAHPWVTASLAEHSSVMDRPIDRFHNTFRVVFTMIFGSLPQALAAARHLYALHTRIQGEMPAKTSRNGSAARTTRPTRLARCAGSSPRSSRAPCLPTTARCRHCRRQNAKTIMPNAKRWPASSAFPPHRCLRIGRPSPPTTATCTPPANSASAKPLAAWRTICSAARDRGFGRHSGIAHSPSSALPERFREEFELPFGSDRTASRRTRPSHPAANLLPASRVHPFYRPLA